MTTKLAKALAACERYPYGSGPTKAEMRLVLAAARHLQILVDSASGSQAEMVWAWDEAAKVVGKPRRPTKKGRR